MSTSTPTELELQTAKVTTNPLQVDVGSDLAVNSTTHVSVDTAQQESIIEGYKKEYSIVGDGLYASVSMDQAPPWLLGLIGGVIDSQLQSGLFDLQQANQSIRNALDEIDVAKNQYAELINIDATIEDVTASRLATLNATVDANSANIITLDTTKVTPDQAMAIAADRVSAELNSGSIKAQLDRIDTAVATTNGSLVATTEIMEASFEGVSDAVSTLENSIQATADKAEANFAYDAVLKLNHNGTDYYYSSGFGLKTTLAGSTDSSTPSTSSEFWVQADNVRFVDTSNNIILKGDTQGLTFPSAGSVKSEGYNLTNNTGVFMGWNPANTGTDKYEFMAGNGTQYMRWNGSNLKVKGDISGSTMTAGSININNKFTVDSNGNTSIKSSTTGARMEIENNVIKVFDINGVLRVKIGDLTA